MASSKNVAVSQVMPETGCPCPLLGSPENGFDGLGKPSPGCFGTCGPKMLDDNKAVDFAAQEGVEEGAIVTEGHASIRLAVGTEHVRMCKQPIATKHVATADRNKTDGANAVKKLLAQREVIDIWWRCPPILLAHIAWVVEATAKPECASNLCPFGK